MRYLAALLVIVGWSPGICHIPDAGPVDSTLNTSDTYATLVITSEVDGASVFLDDVPFGVAPVSIDTVSPGTHVIRMLGPGLRNWYADVIIDTVMLTPGETVRKHYVMARSLVIRSDPYGAALMAGDSVLGETPFHLVVREVGVPSLVLRKQGFDDFTIDEIAGKSGTFFATLTPNGGISPEYDLTQSSPHPHTRWLHAAGLSTVVAGVFAAYFKTQADNLHGQYQVNGDPGLASKVQVYDRYAAVAFAVAQISLGTLMYLLIAY